MNIALNIFINFILYVMSLFGLVIFFRKGSEEEQESPIFSIAVLIIVFILYYAVKTVILKV